VATTTGGPVLVTVRPRSAAAAESAAAALAGGALAAASWSVLGLAGPAAVVGAANGLVGGWRGTYRWRSVWGPVGFVLDSTWTLPMTSTSLVAHGVARVQRDRGQYVEPLSRRLNRHVYARGFRFRKGFAITLGNTINSAGERVFTSDRRRQLVTDHEDVHVWQARWFGPLYPLLYVGWSVGGAVVGALIWATRRRDEPFGKVVETCSYYLNPFEWWAYSRDGKWPPARMVPGLGWKAPLVQPFSATSRRWGRGRRSWPAAPS
jgi:hypothetical protein